MVVFFFVVFFFLGGGGGLNFLPQFLLFFLESLQFHFQLSIGKILKQLWPYTKLGSLCSSADALISKSNKTIMLPVKNVRLRVGL